MMDYEYIDTIITGVIGLIGVWLGSVLSKNNMAKHEKEFLVRRLRIEKTQEILLDLLEYARRIASIHNALVQYIKNEISHEQFKSVNDAKQAEKLEFLRRLNVNMVFAEQLENEYNKLLKISTIYFDKLYEGFHNPKTLKRYYEVDEVTFESLNHEFAKFTKTMDSLCEKLRQILKVELEALRWHQY